VQCCITSPPYWGLRDYGNPGQLGLEKTPDAYVAKLVEVFREVRRVLRDDGTLWLNLGDSYWSDSLSRKDPIESMWGNRPGSDLSEGRDKIPSYNKRGGLGQRPPGLKPKDLVGIPWRVAFALQADGWWLRSDIIWHKPNPMPEAVTDRCTKAHEYIFLLTKSAKYFYDAVAIREPASSNPITSARRNRADFGTVGTVALQGSKFGQSGKGENSAYRGDERNRRSVWTITTQPFKGAHFAVFPETLVEPCLLAGTSERGCCPVCGAPWKRIVERTGGRDWHNDKSKAKGIPGEILGEGGYKRGQSSTPLITPETQVFITTVGWEPSCSCSEHAPVPCRVLDPFAGSGTTGAVAQKYGRDSVLIELNPAYVEIATTRFADKSRVKVS